MKRLKYIGACEKCFRGMSRGRQTWENLIEREAHRRSAPLDALRGRENMLWKHF